MITKTLENLIIPVIILILGFYIDFIVLFVLEKFFLFVCAILPWSSPWPWICLPLLIPIGLCTIVTILGIASIPIGLFIYALSELKIKISPFEDLFCKTHGLIKILYNIKIVFLVTYTNITNIIGQGFLYYSGAIITFCIIVMAYSQIIWSTLDFYKGRK